MTGSSQGQEVNSSTTIFMKEQLEHLYKLFQSPQFSINPSCSLAQTGNKKIKITDGSLSAIAGIGSIKISSSLTLSNVLHECGGLYFFEDGMNSTSPEYLF
ncbi:hypothetical protein AAG906_024551 [Vitis piasezkii]